MLATLITSSAIRTTFGAVNCMDSSIASRQVEIATLRAIGFGATLVVVSVMIEALLLALLGGAVGGGLAWLYCDSVSLSTLDGSPGPQNSLPTTAHATSTQWRREVQG